MAERKRLGVIAFDEDSSRSAVERQIENVHQSGTIWEAVRKADQTTLEHILDGNPESINARGPVGDCPIHLLFLYATEAHLKLARYVIARFPETLIQIYNHTEYYGEIPLHIAIVNRDAFMVDWLLGDENNQAYRQRQLRATATGCFFQFGQPCYYGETPLAFACCTNQWNIVEILLQYGASLDAVDSNGNTIFHLLVIHNLPEMYGKLKKYWEKAENDILLWKRCNKDGLTPLTLAAKLGATEMFSFLLDERKIVQWRYGPVSCVLYPLNEIDLGFQENSDTSAGALELIVQNARVELITHPRLIDLVTKKWERFAKRSFYRRFFATLTYLLIFLMTTILDQTSTKTTTGEEIDQSAANGAYSDDGHPFLRIVGRSIVLIGALLKGNSEIREMASVGLRKYFQTTGSDLLENCLACVFCVGILIVNIMHMFNMESQAVVLSFVSIIGWLYMLFFVMAFRFTGPFVFMIYQMLFNDVLRFCIIYLVFLVGFSQAFFVLHRNNGFDGFLLSVKQCFLGLMGDFDFDLYMQTTFRYVSVLLLVIYVVVVTILLLNLLIAMMSDTYQNVVEGATQIWHLERARIVFSIENEMSSVERQRAVNRYWTVLNGERYLQVEEINENYFRDANVNQ